MGVQLYPVFDKQFPEWDVTAIEGKVLSRLVEIPLLAPLMDYVSASKEEYLELMQETPEYIDPNYEEKWFDAAEALPIVEAMLSVVTDNPHTLEAPADFYDWEKTDWIEHLTEDLNILRDQLHSAIRHGAKFHMEFCY